jgi:hypothetical protein
MCGWRFREISACVSHFRIQPVGYQEGKFRCNIFVGCSKLTISDVIPPASGVPGSLGTITSIRRLRVKMKWAWQPGRREFLQILAMIILDPSIFELTSVSEHESCEFVLFDVGCPVQSRTNASNLISPILNELYVHEDQIFDLNQCHGLWCCRSSYLRLKRN